MQIRPHRLFLIGADTLAWDGLRAIVGRMPELQLVGEAFDPRGAVEAATAAEPDAVLLCSPLQRRSSWAWRWSYTVAGRKPGSWCWPKRSKPMSCWYTPPRG